MDVPRLLEAASLLVPEASATENDITINDVGDHLAHDEWEGLSACWRNSPASTGFRWVSGRLWPLPPSGCG